MQLLAVSAVILNLEGAVLSVATTRENFFEDGYI